LNIPINGINMANIQGLQAEINDLKTNTSLINNLADGAIGISKTNGLAASLDS
jgi:tetrahydromethanopterin S-methyltransferase subunit F